MDLLKILEELAILLVLTKHLISRYRVSKSRPNKFHSKLLKRISILVNKKANRWHLKLNKLIKVNLKTWLLILEIKLLSVCVKNWSENSVKYSLKMTFSISVGSMTTLIPLGLCRILLATSQEQGQTINSNTWLICMK